MKRPTFNENTEVKVVDKTSSMYGWRGVVKQLGVSILSDGPRLNPTLDKEAIVAAYQNGREPYMKWYAWVRFPEMGIELWLEATQLEAIQHKFIDIDYIREEDIVLGQKPDGTLHIRPKNTGAFEVGDIIQISTKIDGANASIAWDETAGKLEVFSRTNLLDSPGALHGFYDYIKTNVEPLVEKWDYYKNLVFFGEWCVGHSIKSYNKEWFNKWRVYDIYDRPTQNYLPQDMVKTLCKTIGLEYIEELYYGPFISWEHCRSFIGKSTAYGPEQEGIVVKNQSKLYAKNIGPVYIKIVDEKFKEAQHSNKLPKVIDPAKQAAYEKAVELVEAVVTEARVKKIICKLIDEDKLPTELRPTDMGVVMKLLPKCAFDDIIKEEIDTVNAVRDLGENIGKLVASTAAKHARAIVVGQK